MSSPEKKDRNIEMLALRNSGLTYHKIATKYGLSKERVRQIVSKEQDKQKFKHKQDIDRKFANDSHYIFYDALFEAQNALGFSDVITIKTYNILKRLSVLVDEKVLEYGADLTQIDMLSDKEWLSIRGIGKKSLVLLRKANDIYKEIRGSSHGKQLLV